MAEGKSHLIDFPNIILEKDINGSSIKRRRNNCGDLIWGHTCIFTVLVIPYSIAIIILSVVLSDNCGMNEFLGINLKNYVVISGILDLILAIECVLCIYFIHKPRPFHRNIIIVFFGLNILVRTFWYIVGLFVIIIKNPDCFSQETPMSIIAMTIWVIENISAYMMISFVLFFALMGSYAKN